MPVRLRCRLSLPAVACLLALCLPLASGAALPRLDSEDEAARYFDLPDRRLVLSAGLLRAHRYWDRVRPAASKQGVPEAYFFALALIESSFYPYARSPSGAEGMWQFMPETGSDFGLHGRSARTSIEPSAQAAASYLRKLRDRFGSWELALAAYNAGPGTLSRQVRRQGTNDWAVLRDHLRAETHSYVPKVLYLAKEHYPRFLRGEPPPEPSVLVEIRSGDTWYGFSRRFGLDQDLLHMLNRGPLHPGAPLAIPGWSHRVTAGETWSSIAGRYGLTVDQLRLANEDLDAPVAGLPLVVPKVDPLGLRSDRRSP